MKVSGPPTSEQAPSHPWLHTLPPRLPGIPVGQFGVREVVPSLHHSPSLSCRIHLDPPAGVLLCRERGPWLLLPRLGLSGSTIWKVLLGTASTHCAGQEMLGICMRGHLLQLCHFPPKLGLEEAAGLGGVRGSVAFLVFEKCFCPFEAAQTPRAERAESSLQLRAQGTVTYSLRAQLFPLPTQGFISNLLAFNSVFLYLWLLSSPSSGRSSAPPKAFWYFLSMSQGRQPEQWQLPGGSILRYDVGFALRTPGHREPCQTVKGF